MAKTAADQTNFDLLDRVVRRALVLTVRMIDEANHRDDVLEGDPKVGGHPAACASCAHIFGALQLVSARPFDTFAVKPHASPINHAYNFLLSTFREPGTQRWMSLEESQRVMSHLRRFSFEGEPVFQSYHAESDPDGWGYFPTGSVGIPPVVSMYTALGYRYATHHGHEVPQGAHHWSLIGDSEFREGSLLEAMPEAAERELSNVTWIVDYNRQNLDGARQPNDRGLGGTDADRIFRTAEANGWHAVHVRHGGERLAAFAKTGGERLREVLEHGFSDFEFQTLLFKRDGAITRERLAAKDQLLGDFLKGWDDAGVQKLFANLGGHDLRELTKTFDACRTSDKPTLVVAHTIKGWHLSNYAAPGNHSALPPREEVIELLSAEGISEAAPFQRFAEGTPEASFLAARGKEWREGIESQWALKERNLARFTAAVQQAGEIPDALGIDLKFTPVAHSQYVWGQAIGKVVRIGTNAHSGGAVAEADKPFVPAADMVVTMAPDVGTSTNMNPAMDEKIYGPKPSEDVEASLGTRDRRRPGLTPSEEVTTRHVRFEIAEANCMSAAGAFGKLGYSLGIPYLPVMTVYDFFIKRAYDQLYYNLYWGSTFILVGTPSGVTLAPEGAQHSWKSDIQMPNLVTWEPTFGIEVDWIVAETLRRQAHFDHKGRTGVLLRCVTRGLPQKDLVARLRRHRKAKQDASMLLRPSGVDWAQGVDEVTVAVRPDAELLRELRPDVLAGGYWLVDWRGYAGYEPGDNVVHIVTMGAMVTEALAASDALLQKGIYANVLVCTSPDLLLGNQAHADGYRHLKETLGVTGALHVTRKRQNGHVRYDLETRADLVEAAAGRIPVVSVADGEVGMLDNLGSVVGTRHESLGTRKPSKCGRPIDVYRLHHMDGESIAEAAQQVLAETALEQVVVSRALLADVAGRDLAPTPSDWREAWGAEG